MSLEDAVSLVLYAFENAENGDLFVQKAPATTIDTLVQAICELHGDSDYPKSVIGTRHGEKLYETLLTKEEMVKAVDMKKYYRIPADDRDLNYSKYFEDGEEVVSEAEEYHSHNTHRLNEKELIQLLLNLREIKDDLKEFNNE